MNIENINLILNRIIIDSNYGDRSFLLVKGDLLQDDSDLIVLNTYENEYGEIYGDFGEIIKQKYHLEGVLEQPIFYLANNGYISLIQPTTNESPTILIVHPKLKEGQLIRCTEYEMMIKGLFSALVSLEMSGHRFSTISLPVLFRKGIETIYNEAAKILIEEAVKWLKKSSTTSSIRYYVYVENDDELWNSSIEKTLGRSIVNISIDEDLGRIRTYLLGLIHSFSKEEAVYKDTLLPLQNALNREMISPEVVAVFGRKLAESLCEQITGRTDVTFNTNLKMIKKLEKYSPLFIQCLYQIKSFGNTSIHRSLPIYGSNSLTLDDLKILLIGLIKILEYYQIVVEEKGVSFIYNR